MPADEPRVYLYGFLPIGYRRYVAQSVLEGIVMVALLVGWFWFWPMMEKRLTNLELPTSMVVIRAVLKYLPGLLLVLAIYKALELRIVLPAFWHKAASSHSLSGTLNDGQTSRTPLPGSGSGREEPHP